MKLKLTPVKDLRGKKPAEIEAYVAELKKQQAELNHALYTNKDSQTHQVGQIKKAIAQARTIQTELKAVGEEK